MHINSIKSWSYSNYLNNKSLVIDEPITSIEEYAFFNSTLENIIINKSVVFIGKSAFGQCYQLNKIDMSNTNIIKLPEKILHRCFKLETCILPKKIELIGDELFRECKSLETIYIPETLQSLSIMLFSRCVSLKNVNVPSKIKEIPAFAFDTCISLEKIKLPDGLVSIDKYAFHLCKNLKEITIPETIEHIDETSFIGCKNLKTIKSNINIYKKFNNCFKLCPKLK